MRKAFIDTLCSLAAHNPKIMLLTADLGYGVLEPFIEQFPERYINVGCAEQNMIGVATGLALEGFIPYCYSIATFATMRCFEQFRNGPALHNLPVRLIGIGGGYSYGHAGPTHHGLEDLDIMATLPNVEVFAPANSDKVEYVLEALETHTNPVYIRIDKNENNLLIDGHIYKPSIVTYAYNREVLLISAGSVSVEAFKAVMILKDNDINITFLIQCCLSSPSINLKVRWLYTYRNIIVVEEGSNVLYNLVSSIIASDPGTRPTCVIKAGSRPPLPFGSSGDQAWYRQQCGLDSASLVNFIKQVISTP